MIIKHEEQNRALTFKVQGQGDNANAFNHNISPIVGHRELI